ncbi:MAG TPA: hypothetical protein VGD56_00405, partial [Gemmatirosa sp.]
CVGAPVTTELFIAGAEPTDSCVPGENYGAPGDSAAMTPDTAGVGEFPLDGSRPVRRPTVPFDTGPGTAFDSAGAARPVSRPRRRRVAPDSFGIPTTAPAGTRPTVPAP